MTQLADAVVGDAYRPDPKLAGAAFQRTLDIHRAGEMLYDPNARGNQAPMQRSQLNEFSNKLIAETVGQVQGDINRAITTSTGFTPYVLETPSKVIFPVQAPFVRMTPRQVGKGTDIEHWKSVLSIFNQGGPFSQTHLGGTTDGGTTIDSPVYTLGNYTSNYQTIAEYNSVTFQSQWRSRALEGDMLARRKVELLYALKLQEENWLINGAVKLWRPAKPLLTGALTGGSLTGSPTTFWIQVSAVNGNGESLPSAASSVTLASGTTGSIAITFEGVINATSYNVYVGTGSTQPTNSNMFIALAANFASGALPVQPTDYIGSMSITTTMQVNATSGAHPLTTGTATVSTNLFDGAMSLCYLNGGTGGNLSAGEYGMTSVTISPAATSGLLAIQDLQLLFRKMYSQARADPSHLFVSPVEAVTIDNLVGTASNFRIIADPNSAGGIGNVTAGQKVTKILNQVTGSYVDVVTLPFLPQGSIMAGSFSIPFPAPTVSDAPFRVMVNQDYTAVDYPPTQANPQTWGFGYFVDETLVNQYQGGWGLLEGIQPAAGV